MASAFSAASPVVAQHGFYVRPSAHRCRLFKLPSAGRITLNSYIVRFVQGGVVKPSVVLTNHLDGNPYSAPLEPSTSAPTSRLNSSRATAAFVSALAGVPVAGILAYLLFGFCYGIGSRVISDATYDHYASSMFMYGAAAAVLPSLFCGLLNSRRPIAVLLLSHFLGVALGAVVVSSGFRWYYAMGAYVLVASLLPALVATARRLT